MSKTVKEWEDDFKTLDNKQQQEIVAGLTALAEWPAFREVFSGTNLLSLAIGFWPIAYGEVMPEYFLKLFSSSVGKR